MKTKTYLAGLLVTAVAGLSAVPALAGKQVLRLKFDGPIAEAPTEDGDLAILFGGSPPVTLRSVVKKIDGAAEDDKVAGIAMIIDGPAMGMAQVQEIREALARFRAAGKTVHCYMDYAGNGSYALATAADHITLAEHSELAIMGLRAELSYYKGLFEKIGVQADMLHCGDYKSALEPYTRTEPSKPAAEQINWLLDGLFEGWINMLADGRGKSADEIRDAVDHAPLRSKAALERGLIDAIGSFDDFRKLVRKAHGEDADIIKTWPAKESEELDIDPSNPFALFTEMNRMMEELFGGEEEPDEPGIGLVYIEGPIMMGRSQSSPFGGGSAGSTTVRNALEAAADDDNVKAIVIRVDSPGGSALASDIMWKAGMRAASAKPVVVSMGGVAGSGGYYVSLPGQRVFADEMTVTGSIGVVGGKMVVNGLFEDKLGITTTEFERGANAGIMSVNRPWTEEERTEVQGWLDNVYDQFKGRVTACRGEKLTKDLETLAGGRVYTGRQALALGLVDELGSLSDALEYARGKASLKDDAPVYVFPKKKDFAEVLAALLGEETKDAWEISLGRQVAADPLFGAVAPLIGQLAPEHVSRIMNDLRNLALLNEERIGCFMPNLRVR